MAKALLNNDYPQQYDSCYQFGQCQFSNICEQDISVDKLLGGLVPRGYIVKPRQESYEKTIAGNGGNCNG